MLNTPAHCIPAGAECRVMYPLSKYYVCAACGEHILVDDHDDHMRIADAYKMPTPTNDLRPICGECWLGKLAGDLVK